MNVISIFRKRVKANIPGFDDPDAQSQNEWVKLADYGCVKFCPGQTAKVYDAEHAENYSNQDDMSYYEFYFESARQSVKPPYDIKKGDYLIFRQGASVFSYRIVRAQSTQTFPHCCVVTIIINITQPREAQHLLECGELQAVPEEEINGGVVRLGDLQANLGGEE